MSAGKSADAIVALWRELDSSIGDYDRLKAMCCEIRLPILRRILRRLKARVVSVEARTVDDAAVAEKRLGDFEADLAYLRESYEHNIQRFLLRCLNDDPSAGDYLRWLSAEVSSLSEVFSDVNENSTLGCSRDGW
jgi:hypothetical protein